MIVYIYSKCSTCQLAIRFLEKSGIPFTIKEITKEPPPVDELKRMLDFQNGNLKKLFNTSGLQYKEMGLSEKLGDMPLSSALELLSKNGMLVKRPFLIGKQFGVTGFKEAEWKEIVKKE
jgi:arsenate reductase (glutaredoxin)